MKLTYEQWMKKVDSLIGAKTGLSVDDLADYPTRDWFESGMTPQEACQDILEGEGYLDEDDFDDGDFDDDDE